MGRPQRPRRACEEPAYDSFSPDGIFSGESIVLTVDEYEAIRLVDLENKTHKECADLMDVSRTTITEIYESARHKIAECLVNGRKLYISGGPYHLCDGGTGYCQKNCRQRRKGVREQSNSDDWKEKGAGKMRVAVTYENGNIFQHFGHTEQFKFYDIEDKKIVGEQVADTMGSGHGALAGFLLDHQVDALICGGIGGGAQVALAEAGIRLYGGVQGKADDAVAALISDCLEYNPNVQCSHHGHGHQEHGGSCGENQQGCPGSRLQ